MSEPVDVMRALAESIMEIEARLTTLAEALPESPDRDAMYESLIPYDIPAEHFAVAESVCEDYLRPAARALLRAAEIEQSALDARFRSSALFALPRW